MLGLCSQHRRVDHSSSSSTPRATVLQPLEFVSGEYSSSLQGQTVCFLGNLLVTHCRIKLSQFL